MSRHPPEAVPPTDGAAVHLPRSSGKPEWPLVGLDVERLTARAWRPGPIREFVVKIHGRCNLACDYCYVFQQEDDSWRARPAVMAPETLWKTAARIAEHARRHDLSRVRIVFHGGEPLLAGHHFLSEAARAMREVVPLSTQVDLAVQTNGMHLTEDNLDSLLDHRIGVGVSIDGGATAHNRHRRSAAGRGSYEAVVSGIRRLQDPPYREIFTGLLCTVDLQNDPIQVYESLLGFDPPCLDFLLPHGNWTNPPPDRGTTDQLTPYADWLIPVFDRWYQVPQRETRIRLFEEILSLCLGGPSRLESVGLTPVSLLVIETDGSFEQVDALKSAYNGAAATGLNVFSHAVDTTLTHPAVVARQLGIAALCDTCRRCPDVDVCGGGFYPHRYRTGSGYLNPSVYCPDLLRLIPHIRDRILRDARRYLKPMGGRYRSRL